MPFVILFVGLILIVVAIKGTHADLFAALKQDVPGFVKWAAAVAAICGVGYVPGLQKPSRYMLALVMLVIFLKNYSAILNGFTSLAGSGAADTGAGAVSQGPTATYSETTAPVAATAAGETTAAPAPATQVASAAASVIPPTDPAYYMQMFQSPSAGFGGHVV